MFFCLITLSRATSLLGMKIQKASLIPALAVAVMLQLVKALIHCADGITHLIMLQQHI